MPTKRRRFMVNIPPELEAAVIARAKAEKRSVANYLEWLVSEDIKAFTVSEPQATYEANPNSNARSPQELIDLSKRAIERKTAKDHPVKK